MGLYEEKINNLNAACQEQLGLLSEKSKRKSDWMMKNECEILQILMKDEKHLEYLSGARPKKTRSLISKASTFSHSSISNTSSARVRLADKKS